MASIVCVLQLRHRHSVRHVFEPQVSLRLGRLRPHRLFVPIRASFRAVEGRDDCGGRKECLKLVPCGLGVRPRLSSGAPLLTRPARPVAQDLGRSKGNSLLRLFTTQIDSLAR